MARPKSNEQLQALLDKAVDLHKKGELAQAHAAYAKILKHLPTDSHVLGLLAVVKFQQGFSSPALDLIRRARKLDPRDIGLTFNHARILIEMQLYQEAEALARECVRAEPDSDQFANALGVVLLNTGRPAEAIDEFQKAIRIQPHHADYHVNIASALVRRYEAELAEAALVRASELAPQDKEIRLGLAQQFYNNKKYESSAREYAATLSLDPENLKAQCGLLLAKMRECSWAGFAELRNSILSNVDRAPRTTRADPPSPYVITLVSDSPATCFKAAQASSEARNVEREPSNRVKFSASGSGKIRVAYVSADYRQHATSYLISELIELHDRSHFEIIGVSYGPNDGSAMRARMEAAFDTFVDMADLSTGGMVQSLRGMNIDVAVDLQGFNQFNRMEVFASRIAPVQVIYLGWPGTSGSRFYDYIIADPTVIPRESKQWFSEQVVWLNGPYQPNDRKRKFTVPAPSRVECNLPANAFVFSCLNIPFKILPEVFESWMRILGKVSNSVIWLMDGGENLKTNLQREAATRGIAPERLVFAPPLPNSQHLARLSCADLLLDTMPYNAHTTASDALWMGVPVVTCLGTAFAGRVAASLLNGCQLSELVANTMQEYEEIAVRIALDPSYKEQLKARLSVNRHTAELFDTPRLACDIECAYAEMMDRHNRGERSSFLDVASIRR